MIQGSKNVGALQIIREKKDKTLRRNNKCCCFSPLRTDPFPDQENKEPPPKKAKSQLFSFIEDDVMMLSM